MRTSVSLALKAIVMIALAALVAPTATSAADREHYDLLLRGGRVVDGTGAPWYNADVAIKGGRVAAIGRLKEADADRTLDVKGLIVAPGFIDMMGQTGASFLSDPRSADNLLRQGITTINAGEGSSDAPLGGKVAESAGWKTMAEFFDRLDKAGMPMNVAQTVGHTQVRRIVLGDTDRKATAEELEQMKALVREAMEAGAIGVSTALIYPPAVYAPTEEIVELARVAGSYGGGYYTHMRNEGDRLLEAIDEALAIGRSAGTPVHIFHLKAAGRANWPKMEQAIARIKAARAGGQQVAADIYPYINNGLGITALIHPRHSAEGDEALKRKLADPAARAQIKREIETEGGWENWYRHVGSDWDKIVLIQINAKPYASHNGETLAAIAKAEGKDPWDVFFEIAQAGAAALPQSMTEANVIRAMREEFVSFCTDMGPAGGPAVLGHPRGYGAFPRIIARYVRDLGILSLEQAIHRMTAVAANELRLYDRGRITPGAAADLVIFDLDRTRDQSTFANPNLPAEGIIHVLVNGLPVIESGAPTTARPGRVLRRGATPQ
ncbi:D-aminoacylase [Singulisphaera sp. Ch08]|uniref:D-aminoacylase n=1 Tax=Singulisphaera sp. Ch08 TaxID=3120278 RepID=A0AAU7CHY8_9BACT